MNLKNQPTVMMPKEIMFSIESKWGMSKAAWMDVAWDLMQQLAGTEDAEKIMGELGDRCELIQMYRKRAKVSNDATIARIGRNLAAALMHYARERDEPSKKDIQRLHTELCAAARKEQQEESHEAQTGD